MVQYTFTEDEAKELMRDAMAWIHNWPNIQNWEGTREDIIDMCLDKFKQNGEK